MIHVYVVAGLTIVIFGLFWAILTMPAALLIAENSALYTGTAATVVSYMMVFLNCLPILVGLGLIIWGYIKSVEAREFGFSTI